MILLKDRRKSMKTSYHHWRWWYHLGAIIALSVFIVVAFAGCATLTGSKNRAESSAEVAASPAFSWAQEVAEADGRGIAPPTLTEEPQRSLAAKQSARTAAIAGLKLRVERLPITATQTVGTAMNLNLSVKRAIEKHLQNAEIVYEKEIQPGVWEVRMRAPLAPVAEILQRHHITPQGIPVLPVAMEKSHRET